jgi:ribosomal protein L40E
MAVKVRCPTCEKVLNAPDTARGKAIKCPGCETKIKVPTAEASASQGSARKPGGKAAARKKVDEPDSSEFLASLDLEDHADSSEAMCPKCGAALPEDATECPKCGVDPTTGQLTASAKKRRNMKGPDPALFYGEAWRDSWAFIKENKRIAVRTFLYVLLFSFVYGFCAGMAGNTNFTLPPRVFWGVLAGAAFLVIPGWYWFLTIETIQTTVGKKKLNLGKVNFDIFQCMALGIKSILWLIVFTVFLPIPLSWIMFPLVMIHMAMPVTKRGWLNFLMLPTFFRNIAPTLYFWVIAIVTSIPGAIVYCVPFILFWSPLQEISQVTDFEKFKVTSQMWVALGVTLFVSLAVQFVQSFVILFNMRVIGLLAYYFQNSLDLTTFVAEKTYVAKQVKLDKFGVPIRTAGQKAGGVALIAIVLAAVAGAGYMIYRQLSK